MTSLQVPAERRPASPEGWRPRVCRSAGDAPTADPAAAVRAAGELLTALGIDWRTEHLRQTPARMAAAYAELLAGEEFDFTTFPNDEDYDELVLVRDIAFQSVCEHHMLPFLGVAHVGYLPADRILGLSKLARLVQLTSRAPQTQERLTRSVARELESRLAPRGVGIVVEAEHTCMSARGVRAAGARTVTSTLLGTLRTDRAARAEFLELTRRAPGAGGPR